jgi:hypothetical protein
MVPLADAVAGANTGGDDGGNGGGLELLMKVFDGDAGRYV